ncbi:MAG TPA: DUF4931 domain-containing protein [candidate division WOR-3 bacterium]|uniref:DUF4931 domain-containing protein n=1 Tax=candidate division WOR-3 bacterium TaxID=2052148 RepID=A0A7C0XCS1_UNCW3|nr:DUF4931 domain-containing protein [candidate division WOR-3 bacterium]
MHEIRAEPIENSWILLCENRSKRPLGTDDRCPFCPGREAMTPPEIFAIREGPPDGPGWRIRVIPNKYPAVDLPDLKTPHEIVIETPDHNADIPDYTAEHLRDLLLVFRDRLREMCSKKDVKYVQLFRNKGARAGASIFHPHTQILALPFVPRRIKSELEFIREEGLDFERDGGTRTVAECGNFIAFAPYFSRFPYEIWVAPRVKRPDFSKTGEGELLHLALLLKKSVTALKHILGEIPYNLILHTLKDRDFHWHFEILPRYEGLAGFEVATGVYMNSKSPERAASDLRAAIKEEFDERRDSQTSV